MNWAKTRPSAPPHRRRITRWVKRYQIRIKWHQLAAAAKVQPWSKLLHRSWDLHLAWSQLQMLQPPIDTRASRQIIRQQMIWINSQLLASPAYPFPKATIRWCRRLWKRSTQAVSTPWLCPTTLHVLTQISCLQAANSWPRLRWERAGIILQCGRQRTPLALLTTVTFQATQRHRNLVRTHRITSKSVPAVSSYYRKPAPKRKSSKEPNRITNRQRLWLKL